MFKFLIQCFKTFGIAGLLIYLKIKLNKTGSIAIPGLRAPVTMRPQHADRITFREIFIRKEYDIELPATLRPTVIIDAGANIGFTSVFFANRYPNARIFSIEPSDENFKYLVQNTKPYPGIIPIKSGLWHKKELIQVMDRGYGDRGFIVEEGKGTSALQAISVNEILDQYQVQHIDILKMDIEGSEKEVFSENYERWLSVTHCVVIELHDRMKKGCSKAVFDALSPYDFSLSIKGENLVFIKNQFYP